MRGLLPIRDKTALGVAGVIAVVLTVVAVNSGWLQRQFQPGGEVVRAQFRDAGQLKDGDPVRVDGVDIGRVESVELDPDGRSATVEMVVQDDAHPLYADARASVRWRTVLGGNFAVSLTRGTPAAGELGSRAIPLERTTSQVEIEDVIAFDSGRARIGLRVMLRELPHALEDPAVLRRTFGELRRSSPSLARALSAVRGRREQDLRPLVASTSRTLRALDTPDDAMRRLVQGAAVTLGTTAAREADLRATLDRGSGFQPAFRDTLGRLRRTLEIAEPLVERLRGPAGEVAPTLARLHPVVVDADRLLDDARPLLRHLRPATRQLVAAARRGSPLLAELQPGIARLADTVLPELAEKDPVTQLRTYEMVGPVFASISAAGATFDAEGHLFRFPALGGQRAVTTELPCTTWFTDQESSNLVQCESLESALETYLRYRPLEPNPGGANP